MNGHAAIRRAVAAPRISPADRWISRVATATVVGLAGIAGAISYSHMRELAQVHGQSGWHAHAFPLSVDGIEIVASLVLLADRRAGRQSGWLPWVAFVIGTAGSLAANVATAGPGTISRLIAGWPALALLIAVKLLSGMLGRGAGPCPAAVLDVTPSRAPGNGTSNGDGAAPRQAAPVRSGSASISTRPVGWRTPDPSPTAEPGTVPDLAPGVAALLPAARAARDGLHRDGRPLTRDALAARLRQAGYPVRNSCLTPLLHALRSEPASQNGRKRSVAEHSWPSEAAETATLVR